MYNEQAQTLAVSQEIQEQERSRRLRGVLTELSLRDENVLFANTRGVSRNNRDLGFRPGYLNCNTGEQTLSRYSDGRPAPIHLLDGLPESWVSERDPDGRVAKAVPGVVAGFIRGSVFFTREEALKATAH